eukprot:6480609-Amphidinium_carterae.1
MVPDSRKHPVFTYSRSYWVICSNPCSGIVRAHLMYVAMYASKDFETCCSVVVMVDFCKLECWIGVTDVADLESATAM